MPQIEVDSISSMKAEEKEPVKTKKKSVPNVLLKSALKQSSTASQLK